MSVKLPTPEMEFCGLTTSCYTYMFYNWQALIGGLIAIGAALYAGYYVRKQIRAGEQIEAGRLRRRENAARAVLPLTLTKFIDFAEECAKVLRAVQGPVIPGGHAGGTPMETPQIPQQAITDLERTIEAATDDKVVDTMAKLAGHTQVLHSIISDIVAHVNVHGSALRRRDPNMKVFEVRTARVHAAASRLFPWARGGPTTVDNVTWDHIEQSLSLLNIGDEKTADFIKRNRDREKLPLDW